MVGITQILDFITSLPEPRQGEMLELHHLIMGSDSKCKLWFFDGKNGSDRQVSHPTIGYGNSTITYKDKSTREFFRIGLVSMTGGISIHIMGLESKSYLFHRYGNSIGKAKVGSYGITFKSIRDINLEVLKDIIQYKQSK